VLWCLGSVVEPGYPEASINIIQRSGLQGGGGAHSAALPSVSAMVARFWVIESAAFDRMLILIFPFAKEIHPV
jgi:hypothetical protein